MSAGAVAGVGLAGRFAGHLAGGYLALGILLAVTAIAFVTLTTDPRAGEDYIRLPAGMRPATGVTILAVISTLCSVVAAIVAGPLSDRLGRRKIFVIGSAALSGVAMVLPILSPTFVTMTVFAAVAGLAFGCYLAVDTALVTLVLPRDEDTARDMGVLNVANAGPQIIAPFLAALIIGHLGGYPALFAGSGAITIAGALAIGPVRSVR